MTLKKIVLAVAALALVALAGCCPWCKKGEETTLGLHGAVARQQAQR
jgi:hypothetical protein